MQRLLKLRRFVTIHMDLFLVFLIGAFIRLHYATLTPLNVRSYDWSGHQEYIMYLLDTHQLPTASMGWETHQPPLYYSLAAMWGRVSLALGRRLAMWQDLQWFSLFISLCALAATMWIALQLFPRKKQDGVRLLFVGIIATLPGVAFLSSRISNDGLMFLSVAVFTGFLLRWWKNGKMSDWAIASVLAGIAFLVKINGGLFCITTLGLCALLHPQTTLKIAAKRLTVLAGAYVLIIGWFVSLRFHDPFYQQMLTNGAMGLNGKLTLPFRVFDFLQFNPWRIIAAPFNDAWSDTYDRRYFWEYVYKSAFIGEWRMPELLWTVRSMMLGGFGIFLLAILGILRNIRKKTSFTIPLIILAWSGPLFLLSFRVLHNAACNQDFRFISYVAIPVAALACMGMETLHGRWRLASIIGTSLFCTACTIFLLAVPS